MFGELFGVERFEVGQGGTDPRLIGLVDVAEISEDWQHNLFTSGRFRFISSEPSSRYEGAKVLTYANKLGGTVIYHVEPTPPYQIRMRTYGEQVAFDEFTYSSDEEWMPKTIQTYEPVNGKPSAGLRLERTEYETEFDPDADWYGLRGLRLGIGAPVADGKRKRILGYWTGSGMVSRQSDAFQAAASSPAASQTRRGGFLYGVILFFAVAVLFVVKRRVTTF